MCQFCVHPLPELVLKSGFGFFYTDPEQLHWLQVSLGERSGTWFSSFCVFVTSGPISWLDIALIYFKYHLTHYQRNSQPLPVTPDSFLLLDTFGFIQSGFSLGV